EDGQVGKLTRIKGDVRSKFHDGPASYDPTSGFIYFTRNNYIDGKKGMDENGNILLKIYRAKLDGNKYVDVEELPFNSDAFSNAHPSISSDGKRLYFTSNRPGGFGG